jgi:protein-S-isoprenylcysteine O-methyltransferase Ste14
MLVAIYGIITYFYFFYIFTGLISFSLDGAKRIPAIAPYFPWTVNGPVKSSDTKNALTMNALYFAIFALQHLIMARKSWKKMYNSVFPESSERSTFVLAATATVHALMHYWKPVNKVLWSFPAPLSNVIIGIWMFAWTFALLATFNIDHFEMFGLRQCTGMNAKKQGGFVATYLYRYIRHPLMAGFMLALWSTPAMTVGNLFFSAICTVFIIFTVFHFEEPDLVEDIGAEYVNYQKKVPAFCPVPGMRWSPKISKKSS